MNLTRQLQDAFDRLAFICEHGEFFDDAIGIAEEAYRQAYRQGCDVEMIRLGSPHDALRLVGMLLAWAEAKTAPSMLSPAQVARRLGVSWETVRTWIDNGDLKAVNVAVKPGLGRPRWKIAEEELTQFQLRHAAQPRPVTTRSRPRRPQQSEGRDFLPGYAG